MCSRILWKTDGAGVLVGRTMDWPESTDPILTVFPRGMARDGGMLGTQRLFDDNPATWTSAYGSIVATVYGLGAADGFNERGLGGHLLYFTTCDFGERRPGVPALQGGLWVQYLLDNAATVTEAIELMRNVDLVMTEAHGAKTTIHVAIEDASGDSAIFEHIDGELTVHHGPEHVIMTNDPPYAEQLALLAELDFSNPSSELPLPGNVNARDRFARATYYRALLPEPANDREAVAGVLAVARNVSVPFGAPYRDFGIYNTEYRTALDLTNLRYFFELTTSPSVIWASLDQFDLAEGAPVLGLDPYDISLAGDVASKFSSIPAPF
jgi:penicillin V acylase-like amidase (Ntn superfamily)